VAVGGWGRGRGARAARRFLHEEGESARTLCNYNRQSKTKPFTSNEFSSRKKGRLTQGGILMEQMVERSQGQQTPCPPFLPQSAHGGKSPSLPAAPWPTYCRWGRERERDRERETIYI